MMPVPRIELYSVFGKNGGFARQKQKMWAVRAIGVNGSTGSVPGADYPLTEKKYPEQAAHAYAEFTGWPIIELDTVGDRKPEAC